MIHNKDDVKKLGTILGVWAHPDDETQSMGGIIVAALANGQTVACITATRGEAGVQDESRWPARHLAKIRTKELEDAYDALGITNHHWLDYPDGGCEKVNENEAVQRIASLILTYQPDSIMTFGPEGLTGHPDHKAVSRWSRLARDAAGSKAKIYHFILTSAQYKAIREADKKFNMFFNINKPPTCEDVDCAIHFDLDDELFEQKLQSLKAMPSQMEGVLKMFGDAIKQAQSSEAFTEERSA